MTMNDFIEHRTSHYSLREDRFGNFTLTRRSDRASQYFQGDDADLWRRNIDAIVSIDRRNAWGTNNSFDASFDCLCSGYDDVLEVLP
jgi:hypothetical protein